LSGHHKRNNMRILLVRPVSNKTFFHIPNLGLGYLSARLKKAGHEVRILDCAKLGYSLADFRQFISRTGYDAVGVQVLTNDYTPARTMFEIVKRHDEKIVTIAGGPHISGLPEYTLRTQPAIDYGFCGEAEIGLPLLCEYLSGSRRTRLADIPGLVYRGGDGIRVNAQGRIGDLDSLDLPDWDQIDPRTYPHAPHGTFTKGFPTAPLSATRGCAYACPYCMVEHIAGTVPRARSAGNIVEEIELLQRRYGIKEVHIVDDNFTFSRKRVADFCRLLIDRRTGIHWTCPNGVRLDTLDAELLRMMERAGCYAFAVGIESGSPRMLEVMGRRMTRATIEERIHLISSATRITMTGFMMIGFPGETEDDIRQSIDFALKLPIHRLGCSNYLPLPGTRVFNRLLSSREITLEGMDWDASQENHILYAPKGMTRGRLRRLLRGLNFRFYFRPRIIIGLLRGIHSWSQIKMIIRRFIDTFA
jgi:anaerobic magnesium-protoporphyrin IX monomethyl ester cyclase